MVMLDSFSLSLPSWRPKCLFDTHPPHTFTHNTHFFTETCTCMHTHSSCTCADTCSDSKALARSPWPPCSRTLWHGKERREPNLRHTNQRLTAPPLHCDCSNGLVLVWMLCLNKHSCKGYHPLPPDRATMKVPSSPLRFICRKKTLMSFSFSWLVASEKLQISGFYWVGLCFFCVCFSEVTLWL